ncbi:MAG: phage head morphogenesis protein [Burkholderiaceae bacterium]|nr:phage head morphogenesis protein [Burkholderiaceae bacterium]
MSGEVKARPFGVQFAEAIDYMKGKLPEASLAWNDLAGPVHGKVFTVAGSTTADLVRDMQTSLISALEKGSTITAFRKDFDAMVQKHGWTYKGKRGWRTSIIFDTNMRSAHMAGRWTQLQENKDRRPYLQYRTAGDSRVRPLHRQWNGHIAKIDDPIWQVLYPPNGWGCRCTVRAYSLDDLTYKNLGESAPLKLDWRDVVTRDGEVLDRVPVGIDPGWDHNVGMSWISPELSLGAKLARLPAGLRGPVVDKTISPAFQTVLSDRWTAFQSTVKAGSASVAQAQVLGFLDSATLDAVATQVPALQLNSSAVAALADQVDTLAASAISAELPVALRNYQAVLWDKVDELLVVVPQHGAKEQMHLVKMKPNVKTKFGSTLAVTSIEEGKAAELKDGDRFQLLVGKVK